MSDGNERYFHLTLGPVQGFVAQARRTRDFWAGSFLLSWLAGVAMQAVKHQGGEVQFPEPDQDFLAAMCGEATSHPPQQGSLPNRFKALGARVDQDFEAGRVVAEVTRAWEALAEHVWKTDLEPFLQAMGDTQYQATREIWQRQVNRFWEINWVVTNDASAEQLLERRKNWRSHWPAEEGGITCMMMAAQQELSGQSFPDAERLKAFWQPLRQAMKAGDTDLREGEILSALAFIKRRFVRHFPAFSHRLNDRTDAPTLKGWELAFSVPSVMHLAALPWLMKLLAAGRDDPEVATALREQFERGEAALGRPEAASILPGLGEALQQADMAPRLAGVDPSIFFSSVLENPQRFDDSELASHDVERLQSGLNMLRHASGLGEPAPFYAILMMDGDSLGSQLSEPSKQRPISRALNAFTQGVPERVAAHHGFLVYAGGDDVLALLPVTEALSCAATLRDFYADCFQTEASKASLSITTSLSGALLYCHIRRPLTGVLQDAHALLDEVAKEATGRDAIAVRVWQPGGIHLTWAQPWETALRHDGASQELAIERIARRFREQDEARFTNKFLFRVRALGERLPLLMEDGAQRGLLASLVRAELLHSGLELKHFGDAALDQLVHDLLEQAVPVTRQLDSAGRSQLKASASLNPDTFKLVRFLAREGRIER
ncbi:type III-B CRISPR-associated protein Cas10/Cmr2 [Halomonas lysinitropha]|uniref:CRISPR-associated protein n=1 Tax=Halomonas lysinitropha TaxID=2607506 RepID=A0A5K1HYL5_9GAMM|nr:type III-B CRISPR-associated protein Cas10/Cmr2 [Halomonas lysinitropha]VVZ94634.1 CRISPR-associated protein [Halomonas lysinitropha]